MSFKILRRSHHGREVCEKLVKMTIVHNPITKSMKLSSLKSYGPLNIKPAGDEVKGNIEFFSNKNK